MGYTHFDKISCENGFAIGAKGSEVVIANASGVNLNTYVKVTNAATYTVLAANSGKIHIMPNLTADITVTLPTPAEGLYYKFIYGGIAADAQDWTFDTGSNTNFFLGGVAGHDPDDGDVLVVYPDGNSNSKVKIDTPAGGTTVELLCDGTNWYISGNVVSATDTHSAFADQA